jgi:hypothetical protein
MQVNGVTESIAGFKTYSECGISFELGKALHDRRFRERSKERSTDFIRARKVDIVGIVSIIWLFAKGG